MYGFLRRPTVAALRHALYCVQRGECGAVGRRGRPNVPSIARKLRGRVGSQAADYPGLKKLQTNGCVLSADNAEHIADMAADGGFTFRRATATIAEG